MFQSFRFSLWLWCSRILVRREFPHVSIFAPGDPEDEDRAVQAIVFAVDANRAELARMRG